MLDECSFILVKGIRTEDLGSRLAGIKSRHNVHIVPNINSHTAAVVTGVNLGFLYKLLNYSHPAMLQNLSALFEALKL